MTNLNAEQDHNMLLLLEQLPKLQAVDTWAALDEAGHLLSAAMHADRMDVFLFNPAARSLVAVGGQETPRRRRRRELGLDRLPLGDGGREVEVYLNGTSYQSGNVDLDTGMLKGFRYELGALSMIIVPLEVDGERLGVIQVAADRPEAFTEQDVAFMHAVARWIGMAVRRPRGVEPPPAGAEALARLDTAGELVSLLAHELNNYLTPIQGRVALLRRRATRAHREADLADLEALAAAVERLSGLVTNLVTVERLEQGLFTLHPEPVDLVARTRDSVRTFSTDHSPVALHLAASGPLPVRADPARLRQVLDNLLANANKYSPPGVAVQVEVAAETRAGGRWGTVTVRDHGPGIPPAQVPQLFARFAPGPGSAGLGLGLFMARRLAEAHGGTLTYAPAEGGGAAFHLALPLVDGRSVEDPAATGRGSRSSDDGGSLF